MAEKRKGAMTRDQEKILDKLVKFNNKLAESLDGPAITLLDNQGIERLLGKLDEKTPEGREIVYQIVDLIFSGLEQMATEED